MGQSYMELITECTTFPYSSEYFDLMKESAEIRLQGAYLECQTFSNTHLSTILESGRYPNIDKKYFMESVDNKEVQLLEEKFTDSIKEHGKKILGGFLKILRKFINFLTKCVNLFNDHNTRARIVAREISKIELEESDVEKLYDILGVAVTDPDAEKFAYRSEDSFVKTKGKDIQAKMQSTIVASLSAALTNKSVVVDAGKYKGNGGAFGDVYPIDPSNISSIIKYCKKGKFTSALETLTRAVNNSAKNGMKIVCFGNALDKTVKDLEEAQKLFETMELNISATNPNGASADNDALDKVVSAMVVVVGQTMNAYNDFVKFRQATLPKLESFVSSKGGHLQESVEANDDGMIYDSGFDGFRRSIGNMSF